MFKKFFVSISVLSLIATIASAETGSWRNPSTYTNGSVIPVSATITTNLYMDGNVVASQTGAPGATTSVQISVPCSPIGQPQVTNVFTASSVSSAFPNNPSALSAPFNYDPPQCPALQPNAPVILNIVLSQ